MVTILERLDSNMTCSSDVYHSHIVAATYCGINSSHRYNRTGLISLKNFDTANLSILYILQNIATSYYYTFILEESITSKEFQKVYFYDRIGLAPFVYPGRYINCTQPGSLYTII